MPVSVENMLDGNLNYITEFCLSEKWSQIYLCSAVALFLRLVGFS
jgi:hypothetical protein